MSGSVQFRQDAELGMDPMVDIVFQLLVFFLFSFQIRIAELTVPLESVGRASAATADPKPEPLPLYLKQDEQGSHLLVEGQRIAVENLTLHLARLAETRPAPDLRVVLWSDDGLEYQQVVNVIAQAQQAGWRVQIGTGK